jgi:hypothetical protein
MAWSIRCNFSRIQTYAQAVKAWQTAVIFPRSPAGPRGLVDRRKKHLTIERTEVAEDIILRLYGRPIVTWHKDHSLTIESYPSKSTVAFANHCTPPEMRVSQWNNCFSVTVDGRTYKVVKTTFRPRDDTWKADQITPWSIPVVNRERAKQAFRETGYDEFRAWFKVYIQMAAKPDGNPLRDYAWVNNGSLVDMLCDRQWRDLIARRFPNAWNHPDRVLHEIRQAIYQVRDCIDQKSVPFLG